MGRVDVPVAVRGASTGFSFLLVGWLLAQLAAVLLPPPVALALLCFAIALAFVVAARHIGSASVPALHGAVAAVMSYLLVLPLQLMVGRPSIPEVALTLAVALSVGAVTAWIRSKNRTPMSSKPSRT